MANVVDIDFKDRSGKWVLRFRDGAGKFWQTRLGRLHNNMTQRAKKGGRVQEVYGRTYDGVTLDDEFNCPQKFCNWAVKQKGWGKGWELDKDLLVRDNRVYGPDTCTFIPGVINSNICKWGKGKLQGAHLHRGRWMAMCKIGNTHVHLGNFDTAEEAHSHYCEFKELYVRMLADTYKDELDPRAYEALQNWTVSTSPTVH